MGFALRGHIRKIFAGARGMSVSGSRKKKNSLKIVNQNSRDVKEKLMDRRGAGWRDVFSASRFHRSLAPSRHVRAGRRKFFPLQFLSEIIKKTDHNEEKFENRELNRRNVIFQRKETL
jgi:hypothetical protein